MADSHQLHFGPYRAPKVRRGEKLFCEIRGTVTVGGYSDGPIPWPRLKKGGAHCLILCADLVRAVRRESLVAVAHYWGVNPTTVWKWRVALAVERWNEGSTQLGWAWAIERTDDRLERARINSKQPAALARASGSLKGRVQHPATIAGVKAAAKRPRSKAWKEAIAQTWRLRGHRPHNPNHRPWTAAEVGLLGTAPDREIAQCLGRTLASVQMQRYAKGIPAYLVKLSGVRIRAARQRLGWARRELAMQADLDPKTVWALETSRIKGLAANRAQKLAEALQVDLQELVGEATEPV